MNRYATYATIVADPPWDVKAGPAGAPYTLGADGIQRWDDISRPSRELDYESMTVEQIAALRVADVAAKDAHLYLWTINRYVDEAFDIARAWGFKYSTLLTWAKNPMGGGLGGAYGISTEHILFCRRGSLAAHGRVKGTWFNWKRPYDERGKPRHSAKPPDFIAMVEQVSPGPYLEMFARENRLGWDAWGNECNSVELAALDVGPTAVDCDNILGKPEHYTDRPIMDEKVFDMAHGLRPLTERGDD